MNIGLVDDHKIIIEAYKFLLRENYNCTLIADNGLDMINKFKELEHNNKEKIPELIIIDLSMPLMDGYESISWIKKNYPSMKIIVASMFSTKQDIIKALKLGIQSYIMKSETTQELLKAIEVVASGKTYYNTNIATVLVDSLNDVDFNKEEDDISLLTSREKEVIKLMCNDMTSSEISEKLLISARTVEAHKNNIMSKLNLKGKMGLMKLALKHGLIE